MEEIMQIDDVVSRTNCYSSIRRDFIGDSLARDRTYQ